MAIGIAEIERYRTATAALSLIAVLNSGRLTPENARLVRERLSDLLLELGIVRRRTAWERVVDDEDD